MGRKEIECTVFIKVMLVRKFAGALDWLLLSDQLGLSKVEGASRVERDRLVELNGRALGFLGGCVKLWHLGET